MSACLDAVAGLEYRRETADGREAKRDEKSRSDKPQEIDMEKFTTKEIGELVEMRGEKVKKQ